MQLKSKLSIKDMPTALRPREKLFSVGAHNLSDAALVAILFGTGTPKLHASATSAFTRRIQEARED